MKSQKLRTLESIVRFLSRSVDLKRFNLRVSEKCDGQKELEGFESKQVVFRFEIWTRSLLSPTLAYGFDWVMDDEIRLLLPVEIVRP